MLLSNECEPTKFSFMIRTTIGGASAFPLLLFGTDSRFSAEDVSKRWDFITDQLNRLGIEVLTISSDSDPKYNSAMRRNSRLGRKSVVFGGAKWFKCGRRENFPFYVQDKIHILTKLRNIFLKTATEPTKLQFGDYYIKKEHIQQIVDEIPKDQHEITQSALDAKDRQNFDSVLRICNLKVFSLLKEYVKNSDGTIKFLNIWKDFMDAYMNYSLSPLERVSKLWYSMFLVRLWRHFVLGHKSLTLKQNFIRPNTYSCMEQNAHSMVLILLRLKEKTNRVYLSLGCSAVNHVKVFIGKLEHFHHVIQQ